MPNLVITNACNLSCPFCFATEYRAEGSSKCASTMSVDEFRRQVEFAGSDTVRFCGGEPTLHPEFAKLLEISLELPGRRVLMMTNGLWSDAVRKEISGLSRKRAARITYLVNLLEPSLMTGEQNRCLGLTLALLNPDAVTLGLTIYKTQFEFDHLFEVASRFGISHLRYSVAAPTLTDPSSWKVDPERDFRAMAGIVYRLVMEARTRGLTIQSDCGYIPPCRFTEAQLAELSREPGDNPAFRFRCDGPVDIGPGGEAWRCYGLYSSMRARTEEFAHAGRLVEHFDRQTDLLGDDTLFDSCDSCDFRDRGECGGGCHAFRSLRALRARADSNQISIADEDELLSAVPAIDSESLRFMHRDGVSVPMLCERDGTWAELRLSTTELRLFESCDGYRSVGDLAAASGLERSAVTRIIRKLFEQGSITLRPG